MIHQTFNKMTIPHDQDLRIERHYFINGPIEVGSWKKDLSLLRAFRKHGGPWHTAKENETANVIVRLAYLNDNQDRTFTMEEAWKKIEPLLQQ